MARKHLTGLSFWGHVQATQILPLRNLRQNWASVHPRRYRTDREARPQRPLPLWLAEAVSRTVACNLATMTASTATTTF